MKRLLIFLLFAATVVMTRAQSAVGTWHQFRAYGNATDVVQADGLVFCLASGNLFAYDPETTEVRTFDHETGMGGYGISYMDYDELTHTLVLVYADGFIDLVNTRNLEVINLVALRDANVVTKTINGVFTYEGYAWLFTAFGFIQVNLTTGLFGETFDIKRDIQSATICNGMLYYCTQAGELYKVQQDENMHDLASHVFVRKLNFYHLRTLGKYVYAYGWKSLYRIDTENGSLKGGVVTGAMTSMRVFGDRLLACYDSSVSEIDKEGNVTTLTVEASPIKNIVRCGNTYWASCGLIGLQPWQADEAGELHPAGSGIVPNSPRYDYFYRMSYVGNRLLVAGGAHEYTNNSTFEGMASYYENGTWVNLDTVLIGKELYQNITGIAQSPTDPSLHYVTSMGHGLYVYRHGHLVERYNHKNSPINSIYPDKSNAYNYVRTNAPMFDASGNLWVLNCDVDTTVWRLSPDGKTWKGFYFEEFSSASCPDGILVDGKGRLWVLSRRMDGRGILCYDPSLNKRRLHKTVLQQDGLTYEPNNFLCMTLDKSGVIWVGTELGLFIIDKPDEFLNTDFEWTQIKVNRDDGSGLADYVLSGACVSAITVDGANRKWIGTLGSGVFLLSADGQETIQHFNVDNSPLPSNDIRSIAVNPITGEVMIGTINGLVSYMGDATEPAESLDKNQISIYPNPVYPDFEGDVIMRGLAADCEVKVISVGGQLVWSGTSVGGTVTWNLQRKGGGRVATGIYNVIINTADASDVVVGRLAVIR